MQVEFGALAIGRRPGHVPAIISVVQSNPRASQPVSAISSSHCPPPWMNRITGTLRASASRVSPSTMRCMYASESLVVARRQRSPRYQTPSVPGAGRDLRIEVPRSPPRPASSSRLLHQRRLVEHHSLERAKVLVLLPSIIGRRVQGLPENPISGTRPSSSRRMVRGIHH